MKGQQLTRIQQFVERKLDTPAKKHPHCKTCALPEIADVNVAFIDGVKIRYLVAYLIEECGYEPEQISEDALRGHFRRGHHTEMPI